MKCDGDGFTTEAGAWKQAKIRYNRNYYGVYVFRCPICERYHLRKNKSRKRLDHSTEMQQRLRDQGYAVRPSAESVFKELRKAQRATP